jgi:hypothetical protein
MAISSRTFEMKPRYYRTVERKKKKNLGSARERGGNEGKRENELAGQTFVSSFSLTSLDHRLLDSASLE